jgi:undecaprenyl diphosphate synthase
MQPDLQPGLHVAIIMDGNGRWATRRSLPRVAGHRAGLVAVRRIVEHAPDIGIRRLTLYAFSSDNWRRPATEVQSIFWLLRAFLRLETDRLREQGARLEMIGRRDRLPAPVLQAIEKTECVTASGRRLHLCVAIDYSSRDAITRAASIVASQLKPADPRSPESFAEHLTQSLTAHNAEVDLLIRTGGEKRLSDFLLWECAYAELFFTDCMWPDFTEADLDAALADFHRRHRRFGALPSVPPVQSSEQATSNIPRDPRPGYYGTL